LLAPLERAQLLARRGAAPVPPCTLAQLIASAVVADPDAVAVVAGGRELTYREMDEQSSRLERLLIDSGIGAEDVVAVAIARSAESILAVWAVAKTGAAFVPVDPTYPAERITHMLADSGAVLGLTTVAARRDLPGDVDWLVLDAPDTATRLWQACPAPIAATELVRRVRVTNPAWMIYTSGSTGLPKGAVATHAGIAGVAGAPRARYPVTPDARALDAASPALDPA